MQSIAASIQKLSDSVVQSAQLAIDSDVSDETIRLAISLRSAVDILHVKGKAVTVQHWTGPEGSRRLRLPDFMTLGT